MTTVANVIDRVLHDPRFHDSVDTLNGALTTTATAVTVDTNFQNRVSIGSIIEIDAELMLVEAHTPATGATTVNRGWMGTTPVSHVDNLPIYVNPLFTRNEVMAYFNNCLVDMFPDLYDTAALELTYSGSVIGYDLAAAVEFILRVRSTIDTGSNHTVIVRDWDFDDDANPTDFPSGKSLMLLASQPSGAVLRVVYAKDFVQAVLEADDLDTVIGLATYMNDLPFYFIMSRLMISLEASRGDNATAQSHQRAQDVAPFLLLRTGEWYQARYNDLKKIAARRLQLTTKRDQSAGYGN